jgi:hypothetical protein
MTVSQPFIVGLALLAIGLVTGAYAPLALFYLFRFMRGRHMGFQLIRQSLLRLLAILFIFFALAVVFAYGLNFIDRAALDQQVVWIGAGFCIGLLAGIVLFALGFSKGRRQVQ